MIEGIELARAAAEYADNKQAENIRILDLRGISSIADYFVICTGGSAPHLKAIRKEVREKLRTEHELSALSTDGTAETQWMVLDFVDVIIHVFHHSRRDHYALEELWGDAPVIEFEPTAAA
ncbi:MAG: ribosome-associated protein [Verrucomicrobiales bacterium]